MLNQLESNRPQSVSAVALLLVGLAWSATNRDQSSGSTHKGQPPLSDSTPEEAKLIAERAIRENCLICHSRELIESQRLTPPQWKAEVEKMVGWGSPLPAEQHGTVISYLASAFPDKAPRSPLPHATLAELEAKLAPIPDSIQGSTERGETLYARNCANCHGGDGQGSDLGPNIVEKPILYRRADYLSIIRNGQGRMPGFGNLLKAQEDDDILVWLRSRSYRSTALKAR